MSDLEKLSDIYLSGNPTSDNRGVSLGTHTLITRASRVLSYIQANGLDNATAKELTDTMSAIGNYLEHGIKSGIEPDALRQRIGLVLQAATKPPAAPAPSFNM